MITQLYDPNIQADASRSYAREPSAHNTSIGLQPRYRVIGIVLVVALIAFEAFNFDTTQYALDNLLGEVRFLGVHWATILAIAFCGIDFAGLLRVFTPDNAEETPAEIWYLMAAWLLGATMNAVMTWYAVSLTLLNHTIGNEVLGREALLLYVPVFVATLVWLTRILFIGALSVAGGRLLQQAATSDVPQRMVRRAQNVARQTTTRGSVPVARREHAPAPMTTGGREAARIRPNPQGRRANNPTQAPSNQPDAATEPLFVPAFQSPPAQQPQHTR